MKSNLEETADAAETVESLRLELERCQRELEECRRRKGQLEQAEALLAGENRLLEMVARGDSLAEILNSMCRFIEELSSGSLCGILLVDAAGNRVEHGAAPSLPQKYNEAIHGRLLTADAGPCGMAACLKKQVIAADLASDTRWDAYGWRALALEHGLRACWSTPIVSSVGKILGTFAIYWREPRSPTSEHQKIIEQTTHLAAIAIEHKRTEAALRESEEALRESEKLACGQVEALKSTLDALAKESAPDRFVEHVLCTMTTQLHAHSCGVWKQNEANGLIGFEFGFEAGKFVTKSDALLAGFKVLLPTEEFWAWPEVVHTGKPSVVPDIREAPPFPWQERLVFLGVVTILVVPMLIAGQVEGLITVRFTEKRVFRAEELELAQALANQAMLAMQLTRLSAESRESAVLAERNRMARDIHDTLAQGFTGVIVQLEAAADAKSKGLAKEADEHLSRAGELARESLKEARRSVRALRPQALEAKSLCAALEDLIGKMTAGTSLRAKFVLQGAPRKLPQEWEENLLRIGQEVLTNVLRHASAGDFTAQLVFRPEGVLLELRDNGRGFDPAGKHDGFGLLGMKERVEGMGGQITIQSANGEGAAILITLPLTDNPPPSKS